MQMSVSTGNLVEIAPVCQIPKPFVHPFFANKNRTRWLRVSIVITWWSYSLETFRVMGFIDCCADPLLWNVSMSAIALDSVAKVVLQKVSKILRAAGAFFV
jgi:hypothetical protein